MSHIEKEKLIKADISSIENKVRHAFNQGYDLGFKDGKERTKPLAQEPILDKIRNQIKSNLKGVEIALEVLVENDPLRPKMEGAKDTLEDCLEIIDRSESEG